MTNVGLLPGLNQDGWRHYAPQLLCAGAGGETQPTMPSSFLGVFAVYSPFGRYLILDHGSVLVEVQLAFIGNAYNIGAGSAYVVSLPFPANRWTGEGSPSTVPLGLGMCYFSGTGPNANMPVTITLADPFASLGGAEDYYCQAYCQYILSWGGPETITSTTTTVTHRCGYAPRAEDIEVILTMTTSSASAWAPQIVNITSTTFDVVFRALPGADPTFSWKVRGKPPTGQTGALMSPTAPWDWTRVGSGASPGNIFLQLEYEPKR